MKANQGFVVALAASLVLFLAWTQVPARAAGADAIEQEKSELRDMVRETLKRLYKIQPAAREAISKSAGYAVFSNFGMKSFFAGGGSGKGVVYDQKKKTEIFMKMVEIQAGLGLGAKKFKLVWVFEHHKDVGEFIHSGWEFGGQVSMAAKLGDEGGAFAGAMSVSPGIWLYQLTDDGLALEFTGKGTKYYQDEDLN